MSEHAPDATAALPEEFRDLEPFAAWALPTERERNGRRRASSMAEINALYDAVLPRMDAIIAYLNQYPLDALPEEAERLLNLSLSLAEVSPAVEFYKQPEVVDGFPADRFLPVDVPHMTPKG